MIRSSRSLCRSLRVLLPLGLALFAGGTAGVGAAAVDAAAAPVRVLVRFDRLPLAGKRLAFAGGEADVRHRLPTVSALALELPAGQIEALRRERGVLQVEPDLERHAYGALDGAELKPLITNGLYGLVTTKATVVHKRRVTGAGAKVCIADTGLDTGHPDIAPNWGGGIDEVDNDDDPDVGAGSTVQHGTHVAGIVAAALNGVGVRGVAYGATLHHARVLRDTGRGNSSDIMAAIRRLVDELGCRIVNLSLGGDSPSDIEQTFYAGLVDEGVLIVAAAGNEEADHVSYPAAYPGVLAVGAVNSKNQHADFSNTGEDLDVSAPGVTVLSSVPRDSGEESSVKTNKVYAATGMTFAAHTGGVAALLVDCGSGNSADEFPAKVAGNIALIKRGDQTFATKTENAMNAGATAAIVYNNVPGDFAGTLGTAQTSNDQDWIPVIAVSDTTGGLLRKWLGKKTTVVNDVSSWASFSGTSMASPVVAGVAGLLLATNPSLSSADLTEILERTATRLGGRGYNTTFGWGLVNADAAVKAAKARG